MVRKQRSELITGLFVLGAIIAGVAVLVWLGSVGQFAPRGHEVVFSWPFENGATGVEVGSVVRLGGKEIGRITQITADVENHRTLYWSVLKDNDYPIHQDAVAQASEPFIGTGGLVLTSPGSKNTPLADAKTPIPLCLGVSPLVQQASAKMGFEDKQRQEFQQAMAEIASAAKHINTVSAALEAELTPANNQGLLAQIKLIVGQVNKAADSILAVAASLQNETDRAKADSLLAKVLASADSLKTFSADLSAMLQHVRPDIEQTTAAISEYTRRDVGQLMADFKKVNTELLAVMGDFHAVSSAAREMVVLNKDNIQSAIDDLKSMGENLSAASKEIRRNPWRLMQKPTEKDIRTQNIYDSIRAYSEAAGQMEDALAKLNALRQTKPEGLAADDPDLLKMRGYLEDSFKKLRNVEEAMWKELSKQ